MTTRGDWLVQFKTIRAKQLKPATEMWVSALRIRAKLSPSSGRPLDDQADFRELTRFAQGHSEGLVNRRWVASGVEGWLLPTSFFWEVSRWPNSSVAPAYHCEIE